jgi:hypothetical protein
MCSVLDRVTALLPRSYLEKKDVSKETFLKINGMLKTEPKHTWDAALAARVFEVMMLLCATCHTYDPVIPIVCVIDMFVPPNIPARIAIAFADLSAGDEELIARRFEVGAGQLDEDKRVLKVAEYERPKLHWAYKAYDPERHKPVAGYDFSPDGPKVRQQIEQAMLLTLH